MPPIKSLEDLKKFRGEALEKQKETTQVLVTIAMGSCSIAAGSRQTLASINNFLDAHHLDHVTVIQTGCMGLCGVEPTIRVLIGEQSEVTYGHVSPDVARRILQNHVIGGEVVKEHLVLP